jgi:hypothetical protein
VHVRLRAGCPPLGIQPDAAVPDREGKHLSELAAAVNGSEFTNVPAVFQ